MFFLVCNTSKYGSDVPIIIGDLILAEILQGFRSDNDYESAKSYFSNFI